MYFCPPAFSPSVLRKVEMLWSRLFSSTIESGQIACISSSFPSKCPLLATSTQSVSKTLDLSCRGCPSRSKSLSSTSSWKGPNSYMLLTFLGMHRSEEYQEYFRFAKGLPKPPRGTISASIEVERQA